MTKRPIPNLPDSAATVLAVPTLPAMMGAAERAFLVVLAGPQIGEMVKLEPGKEILMGREEGAGLPLDDDGVSRRHALIAMRDAQVLLQDLGSRNGTFVNGERVSERLLADGDRIQLGVATTIKLTRTDDLEEEYQRRLVEALLRDPLTGIYNRRHLEERLAAELAAARRHQTSLSLLMIDVDHFKRVNDTFGHLAGDAALKMVARTLQEEMRKEDLLARYGGEEFMVIARGSELAGALRFAERIRGCIQSASCPWEGKELRVTVSIGVAQLGSETTLQELIDAADRGLYQAKDAGRNQVRAVALA